MLKNPSWIQSLTQKLQEWEYGGQARGNGRIFGLNNEDGVNLN